MMETKTYRAIRHDEVRPKLMRIEQIKTPDDVERYIEGCLNDFETAISTKEETLVLIAELVVHIYKEAKKELG